MAWTSLHFTGFQDISERNKIIRVIFVLNRTVVSAATVETTYWELKLNEQQYTTEQNR